MIKFNRSLFEVTWECTHILKTLLLLTSTNFSIKIKRFVEFWMGSFGLVRVTIETRFPNRIELGLLQVWVLVDRMYRFIKFRFRSNSMHVGLGSSWDPMCACPMLPCGWELGTHQRSLIGYEYCTWSYHPRLDIHLRFSCILWVIGYLLIYIYINNLCPYVLMNL